MLTNCRNRWVTRLNFVFDTGAAMWRVTIEPYFRGQGTEAVTPEALLHIAGGAFEGYAPWTSNSYLILDLSIQCSVIFTPKLQDIHRMPV